MLHGDERFAKLLRELGMGREIDAVLLKNFFVNKRLQQIVDVVAAEMRVAIGGKHLIDVAFAGGDQLQNGNVERAAAEIVDRDAAALLFVQAIGQRRGRGLVDQTKHFEARDVAGVFGGLALGIVEVCGYGDDRAVDGLAEERFGPILQFAQDEGGNLRRSEEFVAEPDANDVLA